MLSNHRDLDQLTNDLIPALPMADPCGGKACWPMPLVCRRVASTYSIWTLCSLSKVQALATEVLTTWFALMKMLSILVQVQKVLIDTTRRWTYKKS
jgi:hypothetical protein